MLRWGVRLRPLPRTHGAYAPRVRLPAAFAPEPPAAGFDHGGASWRDGPRTVALVGGYWDEGSRGRPAIPPGPRSECRATIAGRAVRLASWRDASGYAVAAYFAGPRAPDGFGYAILARGPDRRDQDLLLAAIRSTAADSPRTFPRRRLAGGRLDPEPNVAPEPLRLDRDVMRSTRSPART